VLLADLSPGALDALVALAGPDADTPLLSIEVRHLGGALARQAPRRRSPSRDRRQLRAARHRGHPHIRVGRRGPRPRAGPKDALRVWRADHDYYNFVETPAEAHVAFLRASYQRLREIKARYDPRPGDHLHPPCAAGRALT
jgi:hypothetical protein